jgi:hypothetical protein
MKFCEMEWHAHWGDQARAVLQRVMLFGYCQGELTAGMLAKVLWVCFAARGRESLVDD